MQTLRRRHVREINMTRLALDEIKMDIVRLKQESGINA